MRLLICLAVLSIPCLASAQSRHSLQPYRLHQRPPIYIDAAGDRHITPHTIPQSIVVDLNRGNVYRGIGSYRGVGYFQNIRTGEGHTIINPYAYRPRRPNPFWSVGGRSW